MLKVIAFDVFNTIVSFEGVDKEEIRAYARHIKQPSWSPLVLPKSWETLKAFPDSKQGIQMLRENYKCVTLSNGPSDLLRKISEFNDIEWDFIIPLEKYKVYKPNRIAYLTVCSTFDVKPEEVMMVSANKTFGDIEAALSLGMKASLIRQGDNIDTIIDLAATL